MARMMRERKAPYRPKTDQMRPGEVYNDGVAAVYAVTDGAGGGLLPREALTLKGRLLYQERKLGISRHYAAAQNQIHVERVIRVQKPPEPVTSQDQVITEDGRRYRIDLVQGLDNVYPPSLDLTLVAYEQNAAEDNEDDAPELEV